jgi:hypothetical protein
LVKEETVMQGPTERLTEIGKYKEMEINLGITKVMRVKGIIPITDYGTP